MMDMIVDRCDPKNKILIKYFNNKCIEKHKSPDCIMKRKITKNGPLNMVSLDSTTIITALYTRLTEEREIKGNTLKNTGHS